MPALCPARRVQHKRMFLHYSSVRLYYGGHARHPAAARVPRRRGDRLGQRRGQLARLHPVRDQPAPDRPAAGDRAGPGGAARPRDRADRGRGRPGRRAGLVLRRVGGGGVDGRGPAGRPGRHADDQLLRLGRGHLDPAGGGRAGPRVPPAAAGPAAVRAGRGQPGRRGRRDLRRGCVPGQRRAGDRAAARAVRGGAAGRAPAGRSSGGSRWPSCATSSGWTTTSPAGPCRQVVLDACAAAGFAPAFPIETHDYPTAVAFVAAGVGITVLPRLGTDDAAARGARGAGGRPGAAAADHAAGQGRAARASGGAPGRWSCCGP